MRPLPRLTGAAFGDLLATTFAAIGAQRDRRRISGELPAVWLSAFARWVFQPPRLLEYQRRRQKRAGRANLERVFAGPELPADTQRREIGDGVPPAPLGRVGPPVCEQMRRVGGPTRVMTEGGGEPYYPTGGEGRAYFHSTPSPSPRWLSQRPADGEPHSSPVVVAARVTRAGSPAILPLAAEEVRNPAGLPQQACELPAAKRLVSWRRAEHRQFSVCIVGDDRYGHEPVIAERRAGRMRFVLVAPPTSPVALFAQRAEREPRGEGVRGTWAEGSGRPRRSFAYRSAAAVPLTPSGVERVNFLEVWERRADGTIGSPKSWVTDCVVSPETVASIVGIGRARGKSETAQFTVHKNHGYEVEPHYGHGQQTLALGVYLRPRRAFLAPPLLEFGDRLYPQCRAGESRRGLWTRCRRACSLLEVDTGEARRHYHLREPAPGP